MGYFRYLFVIIFFSGVMFANYAIAAPSQKQLETCCIVLYEAALEAAQNNREAEQYIYTSAFGYLHKRVDDQEKLKPYKDWFAKFTAMNPGRSGSYLLTLNKPPKKIGPGGGWHHMEVEELMKMIDQGVTIEKLRENVSQPYEYDLDKVYERGNYKDMFEDPVIRYLMQGGGLPPYMNIQK